MRTIGVALWRNGNHQMFKSRLLFTLRSLRDDHKNPSPLQLGSAWISPKRWACLAPCAWFQRWHVTSEAIENLEPWKFHVYIYIYHKHFSAFFLVFYQYYQYGSCVGSESGRRLGFNSRMNWAFGIISISFSIYICNHMIIYIFIIYCQWIFLSVLFCP